MTPLYLSRNFLRVPLEVELKNGRRAKRILTKRLQGEEDRDNAVKRKLRGGVGEGRISENRSCYF